MITKGNLPIHELIGLEVEVVRCTDRKMAGTRGVVVDETANTLVLKGAGREFVVPKKACAFRFTLPSGEKADVDGGLIALNPVERPKRLAKHCRM